MARLVRVFLTLVMVLFRNCIATEWVVYPESNSDVTKCTRTTRSLTLLLGENNVRTYESTIRKTTEFWLVQADEAQKAQVSRLAFVRAVYENTVVVQDCGRTYGNASGLVLDTTEPEVATPNAPFKWQTDAPRDLDLLSWPPRKVLPKKYKGYIYDIGAGMGTYIYVIDNGINTENPVSRFHENALAAEADRWHFAPGIRQTRTDESEFGHGSCVASKAAGWKNGVSKNSQLVIMKSSLRLADQHWAFTAALDDILQKGRQRRAVIVYPRASTQDALDVYREGPLYMWEAIRNLIYELSRDAGVLVVVPAGNFVLRSKGIDTLPGVWADFNSAFHGPDLPAAENSMPLLAVGAVTLTGAKAKLSQGLKELQLRWAPGEDITCAGRPWMPESVRADGTSFAAAMVAGLAAYTMSLNNWPNPFELESMLPTRRILDHERNNNPEFVWNGLNGAAKAVLDIPSSSSSSGHLQPGLNLTVLT